MLWQAGRGNNFSTASVSVDRNSNLYAIWADHRNNTNPNCDFRTSPVGNGAPPCDHDVLYSFSTNRGNDVEPDGDGNAAVEARGKRTVAAVARRSG